jgi:diaminopimelate decarboxylase
MLTFDSQEELQKISESYPEAECIMRISAKNEKFGVDPDETIQML